MILRDYHVHSTFSDGVNTPEEIVLAALEKGMDELGFSEHAYAPHDYDCGMPLGTEVAYRAEIARLKEKYAGRIRILCGVEQDYYSVLPADEYDYRIGSVHNVCEQGEYYAVDGSAEEQRQAIDRFYGGDAYGMCERYYAMVSEIVERTNADIIGHFDLLTKFCEQQPLFDLHHPRYIAAWQAAADKLLRTGKPFEINTGAITRGYRTTPYPMADIRAYLQDRGAKFILSSDSHSAETLCWGFDRFGKGLPLTTLGA